MSAPGTVVPPAGPDAPPPPVTGTSRRTVLFALRGAAGSAAVSYLVTIALIPFVLGRLGAPVYGAWITVSALLVVGVLADAGIRTEIVRRVASAHGAQDADGVAQAVHEGTALLAAVAAIFALAGAAAAPLVRAFAFPSGVPGYSAVEIEWFIRATVAVLAATLVTNGYFGVLKGVQRADIEAVGQMVAVPAGAAVAMAGVVAGWGLWALLLGTVVQLMVGIVWQTVGLRRVLPTLRPRLVRMSGFATRSYLALSGLVLVCQVSDIVDTQWDKFVLSRFVGSEAVTSFQVGTNIVIQGKALVAVLFVPLLAAMAEFRGRDESKLERFFDLLSRGGMVLGAVVLGGIFVFAPSFIALWLGPEVAPAGGAARLFVVAAAFSLFISPLAYRALSEDWHKLVAGTAAVNMVVNGALSFGLTLAIGFNGPLYGSIAGNVVGALVFLVLVRRRLGDRWRMPPLRAAAAGVALAAAAVLLGLDDVRSWWTLAAAGVIWTAVAGMTASRAERLRPSELLDRGVPA